jgi:U3 small nucleolar ribonucleoprotein protein LCP5
MATSVSTLLSTLQSSLESAVLPDTIDIGPITNGISLLDLKNELFLSYLQNLVFLILVKLRHSTGKEDGQDAVPINDEVTKKLAELRLYIEKGVKPLEGKLKYQIDKMVKAAEDASRANGAVPNGKLKAQKKEKRHRRADESEESERSSAGSSEDDDDASASESEIDDLSYRPNPAALARPAATGMSAKKRDDEPADGIYRPPRITATSMPITRGKEIKEDKRPNKSATLDEFITEEMSTAPIAQPSIGSTIVSGGRSMKTDRQREKDAERTRYEETHLTRLPKEAKQKGGRDKRGGFGGEEFRDIAAGLDRIGGLVKKKEGGGGRKRDYQSTGLGGGSGQMGGAFDKRKKTVMRRMK